MRGVIYARYSEGPRQTDQSIEGQVADCEAFAREKEIRIIKVYADRHISGKSVDGRDAFQQMMRDADRHLFDAVIVWKVDRFGRSREDIAVNKIRLRKAGVQLMYARESIPEGPEGILLESLMEGLAEYYSADLRQKVMRGMKETAKKGRFPGHLPIGYKKDPDGRIAIDGPAADAVRDVFRMHIAGASTKDLQQLLTDRGILSRTGRPVAPAVVGRILRNEAYLGRFRIQDVDVPAPAIIDDATFREAAKHFRTSRRNGAGTAKVEYLLSCKCFCAKCGKLLRGAGGTSHTGAVHYYYRCPSKDIRAVQRDKLEELVLQAACRDVLTNTMIDRITARIMEIQAETDEAAAVKALKKRLQDCRRKQKNLMIALENGPSRAISARLSELEAEEEDLRQQIDFVAVQHVMIPEEAVRGWLRSFAAGDKSDPAFRRRLLETFVSRVVVSDDSAVVYYNVTSAGSTADHEVDLPASRSNPIRISGTAVILWLPLPRRLKMPG